jgi:hypothetical protein
MSATTIKISTELRDRLVALAASEFGGTTLSDALRRLIEEHEERAALAAYDRLRRDADEWASYRDESRLTDNAVGDWWHHEPAV